MKSSLSTYDKVKLATLALLVASLPYYIFASSVLIGIGAILYLWQAFQNKAAGFGQLDNLSIAFMCYFLLEVIGLAYTDQVNMADGLFTLEKHQGMILIPFFAEFRNHA